MLLHMSINKKTKQNKTKQNKQTNKQKKKPMSKIKTENESILLC